MPLGALQHLVRLRRADDGARLRLAEEQRDRIECSGRLQPAELDVAADALHRALRERDGQPAAREVVRAADQAVPVEREQQVDQQLLRLEVDARRRSERVGHHQLLPLRAAQLVARLAEEHDIQSGLGEADLAAGIVALQNAHHPHRGRGQDGAPLGLVVERHVAADHRRAEDVARVADAADALGELPHDLRPLRRSEVQAIGDGHRPPTT